MVYGLRTVLGLGRRGYFIPYRYASDIEMSGEDYPWIRDQFADLCETRFKIVLTRISAYRANLENIVGPPPSPRFSQDWFPGLDAAAAYAIVRDTKPSRIIEIGSGHSTRFMLRAKQDEGISTEITCIDPAPRAELSGLDLDLRRVPLQELEPGSLPALRAGDILFIDSSHIAMPGSDVDWVMRYLIPALPAGVLVHFHDIFLPDPYPPSWQWRGYNEQLIVLALLAGGRVDPLFSSRFVRKYRPDLLDSLDLGWVSLVDGAIESSIWLEIR